MYYSWESDGYSGNDLSLLAAHMVEDHRIVQWAFQQTPGSCIWAVRDDGVLLCLTYLKEQNVFGWSRHVTRGKVRSVAVISGEREDVVMLVVEREIAGKTRFFLERMTSRLHENQPVEEACYLDCAVTAQAGKPVSEVTGLEALDGTEVTVLADGSPIEGLTVEGGKIRLPYPARNVLAGFNYVSVLSPLPLETDMQTGSSLGRRRAYGKCVLRLYRSVGGKYAATRWGDLYSRESWREREQYEIPILPTEYGKACEPFSGDVEITLPSGQDTDTSIWIIQDKPLPFRVAAIVTDVDFGEE